MDYVFNESATFDVIASYWKEFMKNTHMDKVIVGISGGIDSTCVAALACKIFGKENVYGLSMPCDEQRDMNDVDKVFDHLEINRLNFNIGDAFHSVIDSIENNGIEVTKQTKVNLPPRLRMAALFAFAQSLNACFANTSNLSESICSYDSFCGDDLGSFAPIQELTKTEVRKLAVWLGVPNELVSKTPIDGLQGNTDEEAFGFTYADLDNFIRTGNGDMNLKAAVFKRYESGKWKMKAIHLEGPKFRFADYIQEKNI